MKKFLVFLLSMTSQLIAQPAGSPADSVPVMAGYPDFEIVESVPVETNLDNPEVRDAREVWLEMFRSARKSIDIEQFYISPQQGEPLDDVIEAVIAAGNRGVSVRVIVDTRMYKTYPGIPDSLSHLKNIAMRDVDFGKLAGGVQHAKYFIVDGEQIFLGSQNFDWRALKHIHELGVRIRHKDAVQIYQDIFELDWKIAATNDPSMAANLLVPKRYATPAWVIGSKGDTLKFSPTMSPKSLIFDSTLWDEQKIVELIDRATGDVWCQFLSYSLIGRDKSRYPVLDDALRRAAARGVTVKMIVSDWEKSAAAEKNVKELAGVRNIEVKFSAIPQWSGGYIPYARVEHCKFLVVDSSLCWVGTSNWEKSYFYNTRNVGVVVENNTIAGVLRKIFLKSWTGHYTELINPSTEYKQREHGERK
jgi:phosphatidylserine/phosphatidylglycerophosphate/cardiolipin synthase-like enzyme